MCLIPTSSVPALLFPAACRVGGSQSTTKFTMIISTSEHVQWLIAMVMGFNFQWYGLGYSTTVNHKNSVC